MTDTQAGSKRKCNADKWMDGSNDRKMMLTDRQEGRHTNGHAGWQRERERERERELSLIHI